VADRLAVLLDQNVPRAVVGWLQEIRPSWDVHHVATVGLSGKSDLDGITTIENIQLSIAKSAYNQAEFVTLFVRGSDGQWSVGVARFKRVR
jgi:hypothetical protein